MASPFGLFPRQLWPTWAIDESEQAAYNNPWRFTDRESVKSVHVSGQPTRGLVPNGKLTS